MPLSSQVCHNLPLLAAYGQQTTGVRVLHKDRDDQIHQPEGAERNNRAEEYLIGGNDAPRQQRCSGGHERCSKSYDNG